MVDFKVAVVTMKCCGGCESECLVMRCDALLQTDGADHEQEDISNLQGIRSLYSQVCLVFSLGI